MDRQPDFDVEKLLEPKDRFFSNKIVSPSNKDVLKDLGTEVSVEFLFLKGDSDFFHERGWECFQKHSAGLQRVATSATKTDMSTILKRALSECYEAGLHRAWEVSDYFDEKPTKDDNRNNPGNNTDYQKNFRAKILLVMCDFPNCGYIQELLEHSQVAPEMSSEEQGSEKLSVDVEGTVQKLITNILEAEHKDSKQKKNRRYLYDHVFMAPNIKKHGGWVFPILLISQTVYDELSKDRLQSVLGSAKGRLLADTTTSTNIVDSWQYEKSPEKVRSDVSPAHQKNLIDMTSTFDFRCHKNETLKKQCILTLICCRG